MRVALIYPKSYSEEHCVTIEAQEKNLGLFPPLSLAYVASILEKYGHQVIIIDATSLRLSFAEVVDDIKKFSPDILGFTITTPLFHQTLSWIKSLKTAVDLPVIVGGFHVSLYPRETMHYKEIDYALMGDAELTLPEFMECFEKRSGLSEVKGICFRRGDEIVVNAERQRFMNLEDMPFPARHLLPNQKYYSIVSRRKNFTSIITSRGCPFRCVFCDQSHKRPVFRSAVNVVDEMEECYRKFNVREVDFVDPAFTLDKKRVMDICAQLKLRGLDISWSVRTRVDIVDEELLEEMSKSGCVRIMYGIESAVPEILKAIRKEVDITRIKKIVKLTAKKGIDVFGFFMIGSPGETTQTAKKTIRFARSSALSHVQFTRLTAWPGSELYSRYMDKYKEDYWRKYILDPSIKKILPLVETEMSVQEANRLVRLAYLSFYLYPLRVIRLTLKMRSFSQFKNSLVALLDMFTNKAKDED